MKFILLILMIASFSSHAVGFQDHFKIIREDGLRTSCGIYLAHFRGRRVGGAFYALYTTRQQRMELLDGLSKRRQQNLLLGLTELNSNPSMIRLSLEWIPELVKRVSPANDYYDRLVRAKVQRFFRLFWTSYSRPLYDDLKIKALEALEQMARENKDDEWLFFGLIHGLPESDSGANSEAVLLKMIETSKVIAFESIKRSESPQFAQSHMGNAYRVLAYFQGKVFKDRGLPKYIRNAAVEAHEQIEGAIKASLIALFFSPVANIATVLERFERDDF